MLVIAALPYIGLTFPVLLHSIGLFTTFFIFVGLGVLAMLFAQRCEPETKGRSLEQLEHSFRVFQGTTPLGKL